MTDRAVTLTEAAAAAATGDIWLFRGHQMKDRLVQAATNSPVNHVAMAVVFDDLPPLLWHTESTPSAVDVWTGEEHGGVQLQLLRDSVKVWADRWGQRPFVRQISPRPGPDAEDELLRTINEYSGRRFPSGRGMAERWLLGRARRLADPDEIYCAELIAATFGRMGLLESSRPPNWYDPGRFWSGDRVQLAGGFSLSGEIEVLID